MGLLQEEAPTVHTVVVAEERGLMLSDGKSPGEGWGALQHITMVAHSLQPLRT